jgi:hypothetical protein
MPFIRSFAFEYCALLAISISLNSEIISPYSCCVKKGLVYITLISLSSYQSSFYLNYTKVNTRSLYNIYLVPFNKYMCLAAYLYIL